MTSLFPRKMFLVGLTGGIASGKSSVIQVFQQLGCAVIDVDVIARHGELGGRVVHSRCPGLPSFHEASPFYKALQALRGGGGPSHQPWSPAPYCPTPTLPSSSPHPMTNTRDSVDSALLSAFPPLILFLLQLNEEPLGSAIILPLVTQSPLAGLEAPASDPGSSSCHSRPARVSRSPAYRGGLRH